MDVSRNIVISDASREDDRIMKLRVEEVHQWMEWHHSPRRQYQDPTLDDLTVLKFDL